MRINVTLEELLFELEYHEIGTNFICHFCEAATQLEIAELHPLAYKIRCARCAGTVWGGKRYNMRWDIKGFDGQNEIYTEKGEFDLHTIQRHLQDLARQQLIGGDKNRPELWQVRRDHGARRLSFMCGVDPHYIAITIEPENR